LLQLSNRLCNCLLVVVVEVLGNQILHDLHAVHHLNRVVPDEERSEATFVKFCEPLNEAAVGEVVLRFAEKVGFAVLLFRIVVCLQVWVLYDIV
jgi:hypothetical protein